MPVGLAVAEFCLYQHPAARSPVLTKILRGLCRGSALPYRGDPRSGVCRTTKQSQSQQKKKTGDFGWCVLPGETVAMNEIHLVLKDCSCPRAWSWYQEVAAGIAVLVPVVKSNSKP